MAFLCCAARTTQRPVSQNSAFDALNLEGFDRAASSGFVRSQPSTVKRRTLEGNFGLNVQFAPEHYAKKRQAASYGGESVVRLVDPEAFNFTKVEEGEILGSVERLTDPPDRQTQDRRTILPTKVLVNASPLARGHVLFVPRFEEVLPQVLTKELLLCGLQLLSMSGRRDFRLMFNSLLGCATVNHFHYHGLYLDYCNLSTTRLPIEKVDRSVVAGDRTEGKVCIEFLSETQWYCRSFVLTAGSRKRAEGTIPPPDIEALASLAESIIQELLAKNIPHNVLLVPFLGERRARRIENSSLSGEEFKPSAASPEVYIIPRQPDCKLRDGSGFQAAACELSGLLVAQTEEHFENLTEKSLNEVICQDVSLSGQEFDALICKVAWFVH